MNLNFNSLFRYQDEFIHGLVETLRLTGISTGFGLLIGVVGAILVMNGPKAVRVAVAAYIEIIRNTPPLIHLFVIFFLLPGIGLRFPPTVAACTALSIYFGAYAIEIIRGGLSSIPKSQLEAGMCLGLTRSQVFWNVVFPPAMRNIYPSIASQIVLLLLGTSVVSQISVNELFHAAAFVDSRLFRSFEIYTVVAVIYITLVVVARILFGVVGLVLFRWPTGR